MPLIEIKAAARIRERFEGLLSLLLCREAAFIWLKVLKIGIRRAT